MNDNAYTKELLKNTLDALPDGILIVSAERQIIYTNNQFRDMWNIPLDSEITNEPDAVMRYALSQVVSPEAFLSNIEALHSSSSAYEDEIDLKDMRVFRRRSVSFVDERAGQSRIWIFTDITQLKESERDKLTGLLNRNSFEQNFQGSEIIASQNMLTAVAIIDIDNFKQFNDEFGHAAGDDALRAIGASINAYLHRNSDKAYRIGGDEILISYVGRDVNSIRSHGEAILKAISALKLSSNDGANLQIRCSSGIAICQSRVKAEDAYKFADTLLYKSKASGKNSLTAELFRDVPN